MARLLTALLLCAMVAVGASARERSDSPRPAWLSGLPQPTNNTFRYERVSAVAPTLDGARNATFDNAVQRSGLKSGVVVSTKTDSRNVIQQNWHNGRLDEHVEKKLENNTTITSDPQKLYVNAVAEYWERDRAGYHLTTVYAVSELGRAPLFDNVVQTKRYGARGLWRSMFVPGWGQMYKGSYVKGGLVLGGTVAGVAAIIFTESQRHDYAMKIKRTHNNTLIKSYTTKRDHWATGRNIALGLTAALYVYNIVDAIVAPGASRLVVRNYGRRGGSYGFVPVASGDGAAMCAVLSF